MSTVWIATGYDGVANPVESALCANTDCSVLSLSEIELESATARRPPPDLVVVNLLSSPNSTNGLLQQLRRLISQAFFIAIVPPGDSSLQEALLRFGVDEIIVRPPDEDRLNVMIEQLLRRVAAFRNLISLQEFLRKEMNQDQIVARSSSMREIVSRLPQLATSRSTVLITGETGTGKELIARAIHYLGPRAGKPFITVDCGTIPESLVENELFGHASGAFTGAGSNSYGMIHEANGGTLFLDEVEALALPVQSKFLRFLQEHQYKPLGQSGYVSVDVRVVAATNIDLQQSVRERQFRQDLFYRLNVIPLKIQPLRDRKADIPILARYFLKRYNPDEPSAATIPEEMMEQWLAHDWPGNVRELENKIQEWLTIRHGGPWIPGSLSIESPPATIRTFMDARKDLIADFEQRYFTKLLSFSQGNISAAARLAALDRTNLRHLLKKHSIDPRSFRK